LLSTAAVWLELERSLKMSEVSVFTHAPIHGNANKQTFTV